MPTAKTLFVVGIFTITSACGGGNEDTSTPPTAVKPTSPPTAQTYATSGTVYVRADNIAYPATPMPAAGLVGAQVSLASTAAQSGPTGAFSVSSSFTLGDSFVPLKVTMPGYQETWLPWTPPDASAPISIGLYPEVAVAPRPGFMRGVTFMDGGGNIPRWIQQGGIASTIDRAANDVKATSIAYPDLLRVVSFDTVTNAVSVIAEPLANPVGTADVHQFFPQMATAAKARGMSVLLALSIYSPTSSLNPSGVRATNTAFWDAWFAAVLPWLTDRALLARNSATNYLILDLPQYMMGFGSARMRGIVDAIRSTGYQGMLVASFGVRTSRPPAGFYGYRFIDAAFWSLFDAVQVALIDGVPRSSAAEVLSPDQSRAQMRQSIKALLDDVATIPLPVILQLSTPSVHGAVSSFDYIEPDLSGVTLAPQRTRDFQQQADMYQAAAEVINGMPTENGKFLGLTSWGYVWTDSRYEFESHGRSAFDKSANIRGKPAEAVMRWWSLRW